MDVAVQYSLELPPGITRKRAGKKFIYFDSRRRPIRAESVLKYIRSLVIPPAWTEVWISPNRKRHILVTGRDLKKRKQYIYHPDWRRARERRKFCKMVDFANSLPAIRRRVSRDLAAKGVPRSKVIALLVRLLEISLIRIGNDEYARSNHSYGLTTLRNGHVSIRNSVIRFDFDGKSNQHHTISVQNARLAQILDGVRRLPGDLLFQYRDEVGGIHRVTSNDVNAYIRETTGKHFSAKDFRTWAATVSCAVNLLEANKSTSKAEVKRLFTRVVKTVADHLGNTPAVCRSSYIHPMVFSTYSDGSLQRAGKSLRKSRYGCPARGLRSDEAFVYSLLSGRGSAH